MAALPIEHLFLVIIAPGSQMLLETRRPPPTDLVGKAPVAGITSHLSLPYISYGGALNVMSDKTNLETVLKNKISSTGGLNNLPTGYFSRFTFCDSNGNKINAPPVNGVEDIPIIGGAFANNEYCVILNVNNDEKDTIEKNTDLKFYQTYTVAGTPPVKTFNAALTGLNMLSRRMFSSFNYVGPASPLDTCIAAAPAAPVPAATKTITYRFYRPVFPFYGLPYVVSPYGSPYGSPRSSPRFSNRSPERTTFPNGSPVVSRSSRSPIIRRLQEDEYYQKYLKYKAKYMKLKSRID